MLLLPLIKIAPAHSLDHTSPAGRPWQQERSDQQKKEIRAWEAQAIASTHLEMIRPPSPRLRYTSTALVINKEIKRQKPSSFFRRPEGFL